MSSDRARAADLQALLRRVADADQEAVTKLFDETCSLVHGLACRILNDTSTAEEVTLDVYLQVTRKAAEYDPERGSPLAWLVTLTRSRAIDRLRAEASRLARETPADDTSPMAAPEADPEEHSAIAEVRGVVRLALAALTPDQRRVIGLAYYSGLTQSEIAARLELPLGTVKTRIRSAMGVLRSRLAAIHAEAGL